MVSDREIAEAARVRAGARHARVVARRPLSGGMSGARFARVVLEIDGAVRSAVLKEIAHDPVGPTLERRFYEELAPRFPLRAPALYASGPLPGGGDGWIAIEPLPAPAGHGFTAARFAALARDLARAHAALAGQAPEWLPRPLGRDAARWLAHVPDGVARLRERMARNRALRMLASEEAMGAAVALARDPGPIVRGAASVPETVIHRDLHHYNVSFGREGAVVFDWEAVSAGPAELDLALLAIYQRTTPVPWTGGRWSAWRRPVVPPSALPAGPAVDAAYAWEATHRLGWCESVLDGLAPFALARSRVPLLGALEGRTAGPLLVRTWRALFAELPERARRLAALA
jgi:hypothetical protein